MLELIQRFEEVARGRLPAPVYDYYAGGAGSEQTLSENVAAWSRVWLRPRGLVDVSDVDPSVSLLGSRSSFPLVLAPVAAQQLLSGEGEIATARAAAAAGVPFCLSTSGSCSSAQVAEAAPGASLWFQLYVDEDRQVTSDLLSSLMSLGYRRVVVTIDLAVAGRRERERRHEARPVGGWATWLTWDDLDWVRGTSGLPVVVKGVSTAEDTRLALDNGAEAIVVSNHGGRQLDGCVPTAVALREVVDEVRRAVPVLVDGGIRSGGDVCRALALGADAAMIGRPYAWGLAAAGETGVREVLSAFEEDIRITLALLGRTRPSEVDGSCARLAGW